MKPVIAFFDFDGTITRKDTLLEIIRFCKGDAALRIGLLLLSPALILMKLKLLSGQKGKQLLLQYFFRNMPATEFQYQCTTFCKERLPAFIRDKALQQIRLHMEKGHQVVVVTASAEEWVKPWCDMLGIGCISTLLEKKKGMITGHIYGINCNGEEKVNRIRQRFDLATFGDIYAYGDTSGDKPMLQLAKFSFFREFED